ncbi:MAG TPA: Ppx/GppA family phosphatase [Firmicutes bacterium]|jgi:exopolyphosphatase/guanosine-5'-triphosphate,3'-diphosphate pyrophosphatase|nr:MAG: hypothetical protein AA931_08150 [Peptococcaceae bacterium 1109]HHT74038.1 Ppx/GppA family phosphatase [Bacillota bacterium]
MRAVVDLGTNSARLLITEGPKAIARDLVITRLGRGVDKTGILSQEGMAAAIQALLRFKEQTAAYNVVPIVVATSAVRDGANQGQFVEMVREAVGWDVCVLSGEEEAEYSFRGAVLAAVRDGHGPVAVVDIGGGSTEILVGTKSGTLLGGGSVPVGAVRMTERHITSYPIPSSELQSLEAEARELLQPLADAAKSAGPSALIAVGGTATTLAAMDLELTEYDPVKVTGRVLTEARLRRIYRQLGKLSLAELTQLPCLQRGREDIIAAGTGILLTVCQLLGFDECTVSDGDLLMGILSG